MWVLDDGYESNSEEDEIEFDGFKNVVTSSPKSQRKRGREKVKKSDMFEDEFGENGNNDDHHEDLAILFSSSDIVIGEEIEISEGGNREKKRKYEDGFEGNTGVPSSAEGTQEFSCNIRVAFSE